MYLLQPHEVVSTIYPLYFNVSTKLKMKCVTERSYPDFVLCKFRPALSLPQVVATKDLTPDLSNGTVTDGILPVSARSDVAFETVYCGVRVVSAFT